MHTEIRNGERVWTKESVNTILECAYGSKLSEMVIYKQIKKLLEESLLEVGIGCNHYDNLSTWELKTDTWSCYIKLIKPIDSSCLILIDLDKYSVSDLIYLWDNIRSSWKVRHSSKQS